MFREKLAKFVNTFVNTLAAIQTIYHPHSFTKGNLRPETVGSYERNLNGDQTECMPRATWNAISLVLAWTFEKWPDLTWVLCETLWPKESIPTQYCTKKKLSDKPYALCALFSQLAHAARPAAAAAAATRQHPPPSPPPLKRLVRRGRWWLLWARRRYRPPSPPRSCR